MFENEVLRGIFGAERGGVTGDGRKLRNEELHDLYSLPNVTWVIRSRRMGWAGHVAYVREIRDCHRVLVGGT